MRPEPYAPLLELRRNMSRSPWTVACAFAVWVAVVFVGICCIVAVILWLNGEPIPPDWTRLPQ